MYNPNKQTRLKVRAAILNAGYTSLHHYAVERGLPYFSLQKVIDCTRRSGEVSRQIAEAIYEDTGISLPARFPKTSNPTSKK